ncbi:MAG TPA: DUF5667 domain-containing protein [Euzebyales bacterium]|nr:DUF5667 domain-containing protein [Euzebyales bacterium]
MRVLGVLAAWGVLAVLATLCFAVGGSIGYRRGVQDAVRQLRERRGAKAACRPLPVAHHWPRQVTRMRLSDAVRSAHARTSRAPLTSHGTAGRLAGLQRPSTVVGALVALCLLAVPGIAVGATTAQPGESLWQVKRGMEHARLAMAIGPDRHMEVHVRLASRRLAELNQLLSTAGADPQVVEVVIEDLHGHTRSASAQLGEVAVEDRPQVAERVETVIQRQVALLDVLIGVDCADEPGDARCVALGDTQQASIALHSETTAIALNPPAQATASAAPTSPPVAAVAGSEEPTVAAVSTEGAQTAAGAATATGSEGAAAAAGSESPSPAPATPAPSAPATGTAPTATAASTPAGNGQAPSGATPPASTSQADEAAADKKPATADKKPATAGGAADTTETAP